MHRLWIALVFVVSVALPGAGAQAAEATWLDRLRTRLGLGSAPTIATLDRVAKHVTSLPADRAAYVLAAETGADGHVRLVNRAGETFSAATADELTRGLANLLPATPAGPAGANTPPLTIHLTEASVFQHPQALSQLPAATRLRVMIGAEDWMVRRSGRGPTQRLYAEVAPRVLLALTSRADFDEIMAQLQVRVRSRTVRILALEPGAKTALASRAPATKLDAGPPVEPVDPDYLRHAFGALRGQLAVITGRVDGERLVYQGSSGPERNMLLRDLAAGARDNDADLLLLASGWARQPGTRNWLWVKSDIAGLEAGLKSGTFADLLGLLAGDGNRMLVGITRDGADRVRLDVRAIPAQGASPLADVLSDLVTGMTGTATPTAIEGHFKSEARRRELSLRIASRIPAVVQLGYLGLILLGLPGLAVARRWWSSIWPQESRSDYGSVSGWFAARATRGLAFGLLFLPLAGLPATLAQIVQLATSGKLASSGKVAPQPDPDIGKAAP